MELTETNRNNLLNDLIESCRANLPKIDEDMLSNIGVRDPFEDIKEHYELTPDNLNEWISKNVKTKHNKPAKIKVSVWNAKEKNEDGFILHEFRKGENKVWSVEEAKKERGGIPKSGHRIFPCYTDINDSKNASFIDNYFTKLPEKVADQLIMSISLL